MDYWGLLQFNSLNSGLIILVLFQDFNALPPVLGGATS